MNRTVEVNRTTLSFIIPAVLFLGIILLVKSSVFPANSDIMNLGITIDLLLTVPVTYFFLARKTSIPNTTVVAVMAAGLLIGTFFLPKSSQFYLDFFKTWFLPVLELSVLTFIVIKVRSTVKKYRSQKHASFDFFTTLKEVCYSFLPARLVMPFATEVAVIYYGLISWKKRPLRENEFSYHKNSSGQAILGALILMTVVETSVLHLLLAKWSILAAWILTTISIYTILQILGLVKSLSKRPLVINDNTLFLRYGILNETNIDLMNIACIELSTTDLEEVSEIKNLSPLGKLEGHNAIIHLKKENILYGFYGIKKKFKAIALHVDDVKEFKNRIDNALIRNSDNAYQLPRL